MKCSFFEQNQKGNLLTFVAMFEQQRIFLGQKKKYERVTMSFQFFKTF